MDSIYTFTPSAGYIDFIDAINERLTKALAITTVMLATRDSSSQLSHDILYNTIWTLHDYLAEAIEAHGHIVEHGYMH